MILRHFFFNFLFGKFSCCFFIVVGISQVYSQTKKSDNLKVSANYAYGFVVPEYQYFNYVVNDNTESVVLSVSKKTNGDSDWEQLYHNPEYGISFHYSTLGNNQVFGKELALFPYFNIDIVQGKRLRLFNQTGAGVSYVTKKIDLISNNQNVVVGSHVNIHFSLKFGFAYMLMEKLNLFSGISFEHFSNGNLKEPNLGVNYASLFTGIGYTVGNVVQSEKHILALHQKVRTSELIYSLGGKHTRALLSNFYLTSSLAFETKWALKRLFHLGIGADFFYDSSTRDVMSNPGYITYQKKYDYKTGIHVSQIFVYNKLNLILQEGVYLLLTDKVTNQVFYNRGIIRYNLSKRFSTSIAMKTHLHILDYPELGFGFKW